MPHASVAVQVIVLERPQVLVLIMLPAEQVTVGVLQPSVAEGAVTLPQVGTVGLHPRSLPGVQLVNVGGVTSIIRLNTCVQVDELPQASVADGAVTLPQVGTAGLHPKSLPGVQLVNVGGVMSSVHVQVL